MIYHGKDLGDLYLISNTGEIKGIKINKIRKKNINKQGYYFVGISLGSRSEKRLIKIHRAVAETFIHNNDKSLIVNHIDGNKLNNHVDNLEWCTHKENTKHAIDTGLYRSNKKIVCLNTSQIFNSITDASKWCGYSISNISDYCVNEKRKYAGRHPETNEPLQWKAYDSSDISS